MASRRPARTGNRAIAGTVVVLLAVTAAAAVWGERNDRSHTGASTSSVPEKPAVDATGSRPAETSYSWFNHGGGTEQFDYAMDKLRCGNMDENITVDVCAVANTSFGSFMLVGTESFWDPDDVDSDGLAWVPFNMTVYTMRRDAGVSRAVSVMDGYTEKAYTSVAVKIDLYVAQVDGEDVLVLAKRRANATDDAYSYWESVQVIAASPSGAPTVVATYDGADVEVVSNGRSLVVSSLRYGPPTLDRADGGWYSIVTLTPSDNDMSQWTERVTSGPARPEGTAAVSRVGTYKFPVGKAEPEPGRA